MVKNTHLKQPVSMVDGPVFKNILLFSIPLVLSNILQVLFNMSDIAVVGRFAGGGALGSVGSCAILVSLFTGLVIGMGAGINSVAAQYMGARDTAQLQRSVSSALLISIVYGAAITFLGLILSDKILIVMRTKSDLLDGAVLYMRIYLLGTPALSIYNCGNGVLSAAGDSKRPLIYLSAAGVLNVALNLLFVITFKMGVLGVALASVISQYASAVLIIRRLVCCKEDYAISLRHLSFDKATGKKVFIVGLSAGVQNAIFSIANLFIQVAVNSFDTIMVEGNSAAANADALVYNIMAAFYVACTSFMAQNFGAGNRKRIIKSYQISLALSFLTAAASGGLLLLFGRQFLAFFTSDAAVAAAGMKRIDIMALSYCISAFMDCTIAASRGLGKTAVPTIIVILGSCVFRIVWIYTVFAHFRTIPSLYLLYIFSWTFTAVFEIAYFLYVYKKECRKFEYAGAAAVS